MTDWGLLGGNPAPGSLSAVDGVVSDLERVIKQAVEARRALNKDALVLDSWKGQAADTFRNRATELPKQLGEVVASFVSAQETLRSWRRTLAEAQHRAGQLAQQAEQAREKKRAADAKRQEAEHNQRTAEGRQVHATRQAALLRGQLLMATEPAQRTTLRQRLLAEESTARKARYTVSVEKGNVNRHKRTAGQATKDLTTVQAAARKIAAELNESASRTARELQGAARLGNVVTGWQKFGQDLRNTIVDYGPEVAKAIQSAAEVLAIASLIFPKLYVISLALSVTAFGINLLARTLDGDGLTAEEGLALSQNLIDTLMVAIPGVSKAQRAVRTGLSVTKKGIGGVEAYARGGRNELLIYGGTALASEIASFGLQRVGRGLVQNARKSPAVQRQLKKIGGTVREWVVEEKKFAGRDVISLEQSRIIRTFLTNPDNRPGTFLFGRKPGTPINESLQGLDHSVKQKVHTSAHQILDNAFGEIQEEAEEMTVDWLTNMAGKDGSSPSSHGGSGEGR